MKSRSQKTLAELLAKELPDDRIAIAIRDAMTATQINRNGSVEPDHKTRLQAATLALAYKHGKPIERQELMHANMANAEKELRERLESSPQVRSALRAALDRMEAANIKTLQSGS
jgi:hypothetical protein